jgi:hypothetical protein
LAPLIEGGEPIRILRVGQTVGESALLAAASATCASPILITLPPYPRVQPGSLEILVQEVEKGADLASAARISGDSSFVNRVQNRVFHAILSRMAGGDFRDVASSVRAMRRAVMEEVRLYGDFFRFLPILARREGFEVVERDVPQHPEDQRARVYSPGVYLRRLIDVLGLFFLVRFTHKPLRFFGLLGSLFAFGGGAILLVLLVQRLGGRGIANRPMLLLGALLLVLGVQAIAMGRDRASKGAAVAGGEVARRGSAGYEGEGRRPGEGCERRGGLKSVRNPEWAAGMCGWALEARAGGRIRRPAESSGVEVVGPGLIELEVRDGVGLGRIEGGRLIEEPREEMAFGWSAGGRGAGVCGADRGGGGWRLCRTRHNRHNAESRIMPSSVGWRVSWARSEPFLVDAEALNSA